MNRDLDWSEVAALLAPWRNYWVSTVTTDGAPHAAPVWAVVVDQVLWFYTDDDTVKARNLAADPRLVVHSESGDDVLIVRGTATAMARPGAHPAIIAAFAAKYSADGDAAYLPAATDVRTLLYTVSPTSALVWELDTYDDSQRRWVAPAEPTVSDDSS